MNTSTAAQLSASALDNVVDDLRMRGYDEDAITKRLRRDHTVDVNERTLSKVVNAFYTSAPNVEEVCDYVGSDALRRAALLHLTGVQSLKDAAFDIDVAIWVLDSALDKLFKVSKQRKTGVSKFVSTSEPSRFDAEEVYKWLVSDTSTLAQFTRLHSSQNCQTLTQSDRELVKDVVGSLSSRELRHALNCRRAHINERALLRRGEIAAGKTVRGYTLDDDEFDALSHLLKTAKDRRRDQAR